MSYAVIQLAPYQPITYARFYPRKVVPSDIGVLEPMYVTGLNEEGEFAIGNIQFAGIVLSSYSKDIAIVNYDKLSSDVSRVRIEITKDISVTINQSKVLGVSDQYDIGDLSRYSGVDDLRDRIRPRFSPYHTDLFTRIQRGFHTVSSSEIVNIPSSLSDDNLTYIIPDGNGGLKLQNTASDLFIFDPRTQDEISNHSYAHPVVDILTNRIYYQEDLVGTYYPTSIMYGNRFLGFKPSTNECYIYTFSGDLNHLSRQVKYLRQVKSLPQFIDIDTIMFRSTQSSSYLGYDACIIDIDKYSGSVNEYHKLDYHDILNFAVNRDTLSYQTINQLQIALYYKGVFYSRTGVPI